MHGVIKKCACHIILLKNVLLKIKEIKMYFKNNVRCLTSGQLTNLGMELPAFFDANLLQSLQLNCYDLIIWNYAVYLY